MPRRRGVEARAALATGSKLSVSARIVASAISTIGWSTRLSDLSAFSTGGRLRLMLSTGVNGNISDTSRGVTPGIALAGCALLASLSAARVRGPATPSTSRPSLAWNAMTAAWVAGPKSPSMAPGLKPAFFSARCCSYAWRSMALRWFCRFA